MPRHTSISGVRFGRLIAQNLVRQPFVGWMCVCDCGAVGVFRRCNLTSGKTSSCGCYFLDKVTKHGLSGTPEYIVWEGMWARCTNANRPRYDRYGGRGITVCERWRDFRLFLQDMGARPEPGMSIERDDDTKGYEPDNCRWATATEQQRHKRQQKNNTSGVTGVTWSKANGNWIAWLKVNGKTQYVGCFPTIEAAASARKAAITAHGFHPDHGEP